MRQWESDFPRHRLLFDISSNYVNEKSILEEVSNFENVLIETIAFCTFGEGIVVPDILDGLSGGFEVTETGPISRSRYLPARPSQLNEGVWLDWVRDWVRNNLSWVIINNEVEIDTKESTRHNPLSFWQILLWMSMFWKERSIDYDQCRQDLAKVRSANVVVDEEILGCEVGYL